MSGLTYDAWFQQVCAIVPLDITIHDWRSFDLFKRGYTPSQAAREIMERSTDQQTPTAPDGAER